LITGGSLSLTDCIRSSMLDEFDECPSPTNYSEVDLTEVWAAVIGHTSQCDRIGMSGCSGNGVHMGRRTLEDIR